MQITTHGTKTNVRLTVVERRRLKEAQEVLETLKLFVGENDQMHNLCSSLAEIRAQIDVDGKLILDRAEVDDDRFMLVRPEEPGQSVTDQSPAESEVVPESVEEHEARTGVGTH